MKALMTVLLFATIAANAFGFYMPGQGRWMSRDPIGEEGAENLYQLVGNDPCNAIDILGQRGFKVHRASCLARNMAWIKDPQGIVPPADGCSAPFFVPGDKDDPSGKCSFKAACDAHDYCYSDCSKERGKCDEEWLDAMMASCIVCAISSGAQGQPFDLADCLDWAATYYVAVKLFGRGPYNSRQRRNCMCVCPNTGRVYRQFIR